MSDTSTAGTTTTDATQTTTATDAGTATTATAPTWDEAFKGEDPAKVRKALDHAREWEKRAKDNSEAAKRLAEIEESQKTEAEKTADRLSKADAAVASIPAQVSGALREHLVALHEIDKDDAELFLTANEPDLLLKQVTRLIGQTDKRKPTNHVSHEGKTTKPAGASDEKQVVKELFG